MILFDCGGCNRSPRNRIFGQMELSFKQDETVRQVEPVRQDETARQDETVRLTWVYIGVTLSMNLISIKEFENYFQPNSHFES